MSQLWFNSVFVVTKITICHKRNLSCHTNGGQQPIFGGERMEWNFVFKIKERNFALSSQ